MPLPTAPALSLQRVGCADLQPCTLALSLGFGVYINSNDLRESLSNPKLDFFGNVMHTAYG